MIGFVVAGMIVCTITMAPVYAPEYRPDRPVEPPPIIEKVVTPKEPKPGPRPAAKGWKRLVGGRAKWYATGRDGLYAAAGPMLRKALGTGWRGDRVRVTAGGRSVVVTLNDFCRCNTGGHLTLIDLSDEAFRKLAPLGRGVIKVSVAR